MNTDKDKQRALQTLKPLGLTPADVRSFSFMTRYTPEPHKHSPQNKYGAGLLTLHTYEGKDICLTLKPRQQPAALVRVLKAEGATFDNLRTTTVDKQTEPQPGRFAQFSLNMFWHAIMFIICTACAIGLLTHHGGIGWSMLIFGLGCLYLYGLLTRFRYITLDNDGMTAHSLLSKAHFAYADLLKVNFDFAREPNFTYIMEVLDKNYRYYLYYIGRTPRKSLNEIARRLCRLGIDATCSLNEEKKHYEDVYHVQ